MADVSGEDAVADLAGELAHMDDVATRWWNTASALHEALEQAYALLGQAVLVENEAGDNESAVVPINVWRHATGLMQTALSYFSREAR